jgi:hypothetical protein
MIIKIDPTYVMELCECERLRFPLAFSACLQPAGFMMAAYLGLRPRLK